MKGILLAHGSGGYKTQELVEGLFLKVLGEVGPEALEDASYFRCEGCMAVTTDSFVVDPLFFQGGDIGKLAVCGTVNDLVVSGAIPQLITAGFILEEGLPLEVLERVCRSIAESAKGAGVRIVAGDTKVVERGRGHGLYVNTTGIGRVVARLEMGSVEPGDVLVLTGSVGDHGMAVLLAREGFEVESNVVSDCASLRDLLIPLVEEGLVKWMRDPTRGGLATTCLELAQGSGYGIRLYQREIPVKEEVVFLCNMMGYDPLYLANEGKALMVVDPEKESRVLEILRSHPLGREAAVVGEVTSQHFGVRLITAVGGERSLDYLEGDPLPRIC